MFTQSVAKVRLHRAIGYVAPGDKLAGREKTIFAERDRKLEEARVQRKARRTADRQQRLAELTLTNEAIDDLSGG